jgi:hypothetical protein
VSSLEELSSSLPPSLPPSLPVQYLIFDGTTSGVLVQQQFVFPSSEYELLALEEIKVCVSIALSEE